MVKCYLQKRVKCYLRSRGAKCAPRYFDSRHLPLLSIRLPRTHPTPPLASRNDVVFINSSSPLRPRFCCSSIRMFRLLPRCLRFSHTSLRHSCTSKKCHDVCCYKSTWQAMRQAPPLPVQYVATGQFGKSLSPSALPCHRLWLPRSFFPIGPVSLPQTEFPSNREAWALTRR